MAEDKVDSTLQYPFFKDSEDWPDIPRARREEIVSYLENGTVPQGFIYELLCDNLVGAVGLCPSEEVSILPSWVSILRDRFPMAAWGSKVRVESYARHRRDLSNDGRR